MSEPPYPRYPQQPQQPQQNRPQQPFVYPPSQQRPPQQHVPQQRPPQHQPPQQHLPQRRPDPETTSQVRAAYAARAELGPDYDDAIAAGLADRVEELVAYRTAELRHANEEVKEDRDDRRRGETHRFVLGIISLGTGIPITGIAATNVEPGLFGVIAAWCGIVGVNAVFAWGNRRKPRG
jgi:type IV secretory pathway VirB10-like protein